MGRGRGGGGGREGEGRGGGGASTMEVQNLLVDSGPDNLWSTIQFYLFQAAAEYNIQRFLS